MGATIPISNLADAATLTSGLLWSLAYILILRVGARDRAPGMPLAALLLNLAWEAVFSFVYPSPQPQLHVNRIWFLLDVAIGVQTFRLVRSGAFVASRHFVPGMAIGLALSFAVMVLAVEWFDDTQGRLVAYTQNLVMSVLFIDMLKRRKSTRGQSMGIALSKMFGTAAAGLGTVLRGFANPYLCVVFVVTMVADAWYCFLLAREQRVLREDPTPPAWSDADGPQPA
jgi:hypothetical protein